MIPNEMASRNWRCRTVVLLLICLSVQVDGDDYKIRRNRYDISVDEIERSLLLHKDDPFGAEDKWASLSDAQREAWTASNEVVQMSDGVQEILKQSKLVKEEGTSLPVDVHIVAPDKYLSKEKVSRIAQYASAMRAGRNGTELKFRVSVAPQTLYKRIAMHSLSQNPADFIGILEQTAATLGSVNALFVIVNHQGEPFNEFAASLPFVGNGRVSWIMHNIEKARSVNIPVVLVASERAAERVYAPEPLYFPVPLIRHLRIELAAYTPGHKHRAVWLQKFSLSEFESAVRAIAVHGQRVGFFSSQANAECRKCERAFRDVETYERDFPNRAAKILNNDVAPNETWARGMLSTYAKKRIQPNSFRLYVLDTTKLTKTEYLQRLERRMLSVYPGMGFVIFRSSDDVAVEKLESQLIKAIIAGVYGITEPDLYMHSKLERQISKQTKRPSLILSDLVVRNLVRSIVKKRLLELDEIVEGLLYFNIDPAKSLGDHEYAYFAQRVNLMMFKLQRAQRILVGESNNSSAALSLASSASHDIKAIRTAFDISADHKSFDRFRDPTLRCHLSRLQREALRASQILESGYPKVIHFAWATMSFTMAAIAMYFMLNRYSRQKTRGKRE